MIAVCGYYFTEIEEENGNIITLAKGCIYNVFLADMYVF